MYAAFVQVFELDFFGFFFGIEGVVIEFADSTVMILLFLPLCAFARFLNTLLLYQYGKLITIQR